MKGAAVGAAMALAKLVPASWIVQTLVIAGSFAVVVFLLLLGVVAVFSSSAGGVVAVAGFPALALLAEGVGSGVEAGGSAGLAAVVAVLVERLASMRAISRGSCLA